MTYYEHMLIIIKKRNESDMARPQCCRRVTGTPGCRIFRPESTQHSISETLHLTLDELEALRLADLQGLYQEEAAKKMNVSRQTFGRIIESARRKTARALVESRILKIEGGNCSVGGTGCMRCSDCHKRVEIPPHSPVPGVCPSCKSRNLHMEETYRDVENNIGRILPEKQTEK